MEQTTQPQEKKRKKPRRRITQMQQRAKMFNSLWPELFDLAAVKPLKIGIDQELLADAHQRGIELPIEHITRFLARWTQRHAYWRAILRGEFRHGLNGETIPITDVDRAWAKGWKDGSKAQFYASQRETK